MSNKQIISYCKIIKKRDTKIRMNGNQFLAMLNRGEMRALTPEEMRDTPDDECRPNQKTVLPGDLNDWFDQSNQRGHEIGKTASGK